MGSARPPFLPQSPDELLAWLRSNSNWHRWGADDEIGALNLITPAKRVAAAGLVRSGRTVSLAREMAMEPGSPDDPYPTQHQVYRDDYGADVASFGDYFGFRYHGRGVTHIDALCHFFSRDGLWNGRDPDVEFSPAAIGWADITAWSDGIVTRGVLIDVPRFRGVPSVTADTPVHGEELERIVAAQGVVLEPGDALVVHSGRAAWLEGAPGREYGVGPDGAPGLHASCLQFLHDHDVALLLWDLLDAKPNDYGGLGVHHSVWAFGIGLVDNCRLEPLADACAEESRYEFMLSCSPLNIKGATGCPVNPIALF